MGQRLIGKDKTRAGMSLKDTQMNAAGTQRRLYPKLKRVEWL